MAPKKLMKHRCPECRSTRSISRGYRKSRGRRTNKRVCESCGEKIGIKRLEARPVAELCIDCKVEQERSERTMAEPASE